MALSRKQEAAIPALLQCGTYASAAAMAGVNAFTLRRWRKQAEFAEALNSARDEVTEQARVVLMASLGEAVAALRTVVAGELNVTATRMHGIRTTLEYAIKVQEQDTVAKECETLRRQYEELLTYVQTTHTHTPHHAEQSNPDPVEPSTAQE